MTGHIHHSFYGIVLAAAIGAAEVPYAWAQEPPPPDAPASAVPGAAPGEAAPLVPKPLPAAKDVRSILYTDDELDALHKAKTSYERRLAGKPDDDRIEEDEFIKQLEDLSKPKLTERYYTYPQFFLATILYHSATDWAIWLNDQKITQDPLTNPPGLSVLQITPDMVTLRWKPEKMDKVADVGESGPVRVDMINGAVDFTLKGNQTFSSYAMQVLEGKVAPITVDLDPKAGVETATGAPTSTPAPAPVSPKKDGPKTGISGLIGAYQKIGDEKN